MEKGQGVMSDSDKGRKKRVSIHIPDDIRQIMEEKKDEIGQSLNSQVQEVLVQHFRPKKDEESSSG